MPRNKRRTTKAPANRTKRNSCRILLVIYNEPIRLKALQNCRTALRQRNKARLEWERYDKTDRPAFEQWLHREFGAQLTRLRELGQTICEAEDLIQAVEIEALRRGGSRATAYERVLRAREEAAEGNENDAEEDSGGTDDGGEWEDADDFEDPFGPEETEDPFGESENDFKDFMRGLFGCSDEEAAEAFERLCGRARSTAPAAPKACARIKDVYRTLVRRLHPDTMDQTDAVKQNLWHAVQEAYQARDLDRLESLLARCDMEEGVVSEITSVSQLRRSWREIKKGVNSLRSQLRHARKDTAWDFTSRKPEAKASLRRRIAHDIQSDLREQTDLYDELKEIIAGWENCCQERRQPAPARAEVAGVAAGAPMKEKADGPPGKKRRASSRDNSLQGEFFF